MINKNIILIDGGTVCGEGYVKDVWRDWILVVLDCGHTLLINLKRVEIIIND
jgi:hypothetical protein